MLNRITKLVIECHYLFNLGKRTILVEVDNKIRSLQNGKKV